jgi:predicted nuclease of restriction endonuclease-like (RecB) superfamily
MRFELVDDALRRWLPVSRSRLPISCQAVPRLKKGSARVSVSGPLRNIRQFYLTFPNGSALPENRQAALAGSGKPGIGQALLAASQGGSSRSSFTAASFPSAIGWTHYLILMRVPRPEARAFYEIEAARECWSTRQLERQIGSLLFDRLARQRDPEAVLALARAGQEVATAADVLKEPFVLEFLDVAAHPALHERDIEQAIIDRLEAFLLEMGKGFCFVGQQKRLTVDGDHFYVDLVFYTRLLRCFVLVDLKLGDIDADSLMSGADLIVITESDRMFRTIVAVLDIHT